MLAPQKVVVMSNLGYDYPDSDDMEKFLEFGEDLIREIADLPPTPPLMTDDAPEPYSE